MMQSTRTLFKKKWGNSRETHKMLKVNHTKWKKRYQAEESAFRTRLKKPQELISQKRNLASLKNLIAVKSLSII